MRAFITIASTAATRPPPSRGSSRWLTTPRSTPARIERITCCFSGGKNSTMRPTVSAASIVCSVESTRWPDSAAWSAVCAVSASRSSPIRIVSGSWRSARRSAWPKRLGVEPDLALVDDAALVLVQDLDRVLDRDDVLRPASSVHVVDHRGERRRLPRAGRAGDEDEAAVLLGERLDAGRHAELLEASAPSGDDAEREASRAALPVGVHAEARQVLVLVGDVEVAARLEVLEALGRPAADDLEHGGERRLVERRGALDRVEIAVAADDRRPADLQVDVARTHLDGVPEQPVQVHGSGIGCGGARL